MIEFASLILYLSSFAFSIVLITIGTNEMKRGFSPLVIIALCIPILLATFRYGVGTDFFNYMRSVNSVGEISLKEYVESNLIFELGHFLVRKIAFTFDNYSLLLSIYSTMTIMIIYLAIKQHRNKVSIGVSLFLFLCIYYPFSLNIMPQFVAVSIIALSFKYVFKRNLIKFSVMVLAASLFHTTALIALPVYFLWDKKSEDMTSRWKVFVSIILSLIIAFNYQGLLESMSSIDLFDQYGMYAIENQRGQNRDIFLKLLLFGAVFLLRKPLIKHDKRNKLYILLILFNLILAITGFSSPWVKRAGLYFEVVQIFLLPSLIQLFFSRKDRMVVGLVVIVYAISYFTLVYYILGQSSVIPYKLSL